MATPVKVTVWLWLPFVKATVVSSALKEVIVGFTLSVYTVEIVILSVDVFPAASVTVSAAAEEVAALPNIGLLNALVNVYVLPLTLVWVAPVMATELTPTSSLVTTVNVTVLSALSFWDANQVSWVALALYEVIVGATLSVFVILTLTDSLELFPAASVTVNVNESVAEPNE